MNANFNCSDRSYAKKITTFLSEKKVKLVGVCSVEALELNPNRQRHQTNLYLVRSQAKTLKDTEIYAGLSG